MLVVWRTCGWFFLGGVFIFHLGIRYILHWSREKNKRRKISNLVNRKISYITKLEMLGLFLLIVICYTNYVYSVYVSYGLNTFSCLTY